MLNKIELEQYCQLGDIIQLVTNQTTGMGTLTKMTDNALQIEAHNNEEIIEEFGEPIPVPTIFPLSELKLILIISRD